MALFWSSVDLTGNQTSSSVSSSSTLFWSSVDLTGNQTEVSITVPNKCFGAVSI